MHPKSIKAGGFTLIELMIVVAIIGILASIAIPSYRQYVTKSRRAEAQAYMMTLSMNEEKYRANNPNYANHTTLGVTNTAYYTFTISAASNTYTITATAAGTQASDSGCTPLTLDQNGGKGPTACWKS